MEKNPFLSEISSLIGQRYPEHRDAVWASALARFETLCAENAEMRDIRFGGRNAGKMLEYRLVPLMTCCVKIGEELSAAALTRGLGGEVRRTNICKIGFRFADWVVIALCAVPFVMLLLELPGLWR